ncbi:MAG: GNAT family N-acetyltransferase [Lachnotalea sp.]
MRLVFRKMMEQDLEMVMNWRMQADVTKFMATNPKLTLEMQLIWYEKQKKNLNSYYWVVEIDSVSVGIVSILMQEDGKCGETSAYIAEKEYKNFPNMVSIMASLLNFYFDELDADILFGEVFADNKGVVLINRHLNYHVDSIEEGAVEKEGIKYDLMKLSMSKESWYRRREQIKFIPAEIIHLVSAELDKEELRLLSLKAFEIRQDVLNMSKAAGKSGLHFGGTFSLVEIITSLYFNCMNFSKYNYRTDIRDRLILSKGHGVPVIYAVLKQMHIISEKDLETFKSDETELFGHPSMNENLGIEFSSGSLGQGLSLGVGSAIGLKRKNNSSHIFVIMGDGECNEGSVWEAAVSATHYQLNNITVIVDRNQLQYDGYTESIMSMGLLEDKFKSFGWETYVIDGHNIEECCKAFDRRSIKPIAIIADTIKGKGISFMENDAKWHHNILTAELYQKALEELINVEL